MAKDKKIAGKPGYSTLPKMPRFGAQKRIRIPQPNKRPLRFQVRSIIRHKEIDKDPYWLTLHRRGPNRSWVGENQLEARAVSHELVRGTLPERITWKYLVDIMHFVPDVDFDFQSSLQGGRIDAGGIVADFMFKTLKVVIQVQGPTHLEFLRTKKDEEQESVLAEMGYVVYYLWEEDILNEEKLDTKMKKIFGWFHGGGTDTISEYDLQEANAGFWTDRLYESIQELENMIWAIA